jgi:predicted enzyme related to lactoylglutathione lyase
MDPVVHFEMPYENKTRMAKFYKALFGWKIKTLGPEMGDYVLATTTETDEKGPVKPGAINGGFYPKRKKPDCPSIVVAVDDADKSVEKVIKAGGKILGKPVDIPEVGRYVSFVDTEGNRVTLLEPIPRNWHAPKAKKRK